MQGLGVVVVLAHVLMFTHAVKLALGCLPEPHGVQVALPGAVDTWVGPQLCSVQWVQGAHGARA